MIFSNLKDKISKVRTSVVAIGFKPNQNQVTITGSGFSITDDGKILSAAHIYNQVPQNQAQNLMAMVMTEQEINGLERYTWLPLKLIRKNDQDDVSLFQIEGFQKTLLSKLDLGNSDKIEIGAETFFVGFPYAAQLINEGFGITLVVNRGIVSTIKRDGVDPSHKRNFIFVDAISNPGNSGCPLIDIETNTVIGIMSISFRTKSQVQQNLDIREPMHICAAKPINLAKSLLS